MESGNAEGANELLSPYQRNIPESFEVKFTAQRDWRFWETMAFYLGGVGAGLYVVSQFPNNKVGLIAGFMLVVVFKNLAHLLSASKPSRALRAFSNPRNSWISRGAYFIALFALFGIIDIGYRFGLFEWSAAIGKSASFLALFLACMIMMYIGFVMGQSRSMPLWRTPLLPVLLLTYSLAMGAGAGLLVQLFGEPGEEFIFLGRWFLIAGGLTLLLAVINVGLLSVSNETARFSVQVLTRGDTGVMFVGGSLIAGLLIPMGLAGYGLITGDFSPTLCFFVGVLGLIGGFMFETGLLRAGVYAPLIDVS